MLKTIRVGVGLALAAACVGGVAAARIAPSAAPAWGTVPPRAGWTALNHTLPETQGPRWVVLAISPPGLADRIKGLLVAAIARDIGRAQRPATPAGAD